MTYNKAWLQEFTQKDGPNVTFGDNSQARVKGNGTLVTSDIIFKNVSYVEGLKHNLISISQICDKGYHVTCTRNLCQVRDKNNKIVLTGIRKGNLYCLNLEVVDSSNAHCLLTYSQSDMSWLWHKRLAHLILKSISKLANSNLVKGLPKIPFKKDKLCKACQCGKQTKSSF